MPTMAEGKEIEGCNRLGSTLECCWQLRCKLSSARLDSVFCEAGAACHAVLQGPLCSAGECWQAEASCPLPSGRVQQRVSESVAS